VDPFFGRTLSASSQAYVRGLSGWSVSRLEREPRLLAAQLAQLQASLEDLSLRHYPTFLRTHHVLLSAREQVGSIESRMATLGSRVLPGLSEACQAFQSAAPGIMAAGEKQRILAREQSFLLELLEVPALMDTAFKNGLVHEALQLDLFVKELVERQQALAATTRATERAAAMAKGGVEFEGDIEPPPVPAILGLLQQEMSVIKSNIVRSLLAQLRGPLDIESGFPIVGLLKRTLDIFAPSSSAGGDSALLLRYQFLLARDAYFESCLRGLRAPALPAPPSEGVPPPPSPFAEMIAAASAAAAASPFPVSASSAVGGLPALGSPALHATLFAFLDELVSTTRRQLIDSVTLYAALFLDNDDAAAATPSVNSSATLPSFPATSPAHARGGSSTTALSDEARQQSSATSLLCRWVHYRVSLLLSTLRSLLPYLSDGSYLLKLLSSLSSFAERLFRSSREGVDFRPALVEMLQGAVMHAVRRGAERAAGADFEHNMRAYAWRIPAAQLAKLGITPLPQAKEHAAALSPFAGALLPFPPLKLLADALIALVNELAKCAPLAIAPAVGEQIQKSLAQVAQKIRHAQITQAAGAGSGGAIGAGAGGLANGDSKPSAASASTAGGSSADLLELARAFRDTLLPFAQALLGRVYPTAQALLDLPALQAPLAPLFEEEEREQQQQRALEQQRQEQQQREQEAAAAAVTAVAAAPTTAEDVSSSATATPADSADAAAPAASPVADQHTATPSAASALSAQMSPVPAAALSMPLPSPSGSPLSNGTGAAALLSNPPNSSLPTTTIPATSPFVSSFDDPSDPFAQAEAQLRLSAAKRQN